MAVRDLTDSKGNTWRVWDVGADQIHPATRAEDYLFEYSTGWLVFECDSEKRRLAAPYPVDWVRLPDDELEKLMARAVAVRRVPGPLHAPTFTGQKRTFTSPRGRTWTVGLHECQDRFGIRQIVLRFTADDVVVDVEKWPHDWTTLNASEYALLLLDANAPRRPGPDGPQRRRSDRPEMTA